jgi:acetyltransferase-like isoleucine patch superfamily enzyme
MGIKNFLLRAISKNRNKYLFKKKNIHTGRNTKFQNLENIDIGENVFIGDDSVIAALIGYDTHLGFQKLSSSIVLGKGIQATSRLQIYAAAEIIIEDYVLFGSNVFICDGLHGYDNVNVPFMHQPLTKIAPIRIGEGSWIGQNVVIMPGVLIGKYSVIGANSVVTKSVEDYSIAVGSPARTVKKWNQISNSWDIIENNN